MGYLSVLSKQAAAECRSQAGEREGEGEGEREGEEDRAAAPKFQPEQVDLFIECTHKSGKAWCWTGVRVATARSTLRGATGTANRLER